MTIKANQQRRSMFGYAPHLLADSPSHSTTRRGKGRLTQVWAAVIGAAVGGHLGAPCIAQTPPALPSAIPVADHDAIQSLYVKHCTACHGADGHGNGPAAEYLFPKPRAFKDSPIRFGRIERTIRDGLPRSAMPGFANVLKDEQVTGLARFVAELREKSADRTGPWRSNMPAEVPERPYLGGLVDYGSVLYHSMSCASCHGSAGHGDGGEGLVDSLGKPVRPADLASGLYKSGQRAEDLYRTIVEGVPGTPMPAFGRTLIGDRGSGANSVWALVAYIQSLAPAQFHGQSSGAELRLQAAEEAMLTDPAHLGWLRVESTLIAVRPLWFRVEDTVTVSISVVRAGGNLGVHVSWDDPTCDVNQDGGRFPDGIAIMYARSDEVPPLPMGVQIEHQTATAPVNIWHWKASRQFDASTGRRHDADEPRILPKGGYHLFGMPPAPLVETAPASPIPVVDQDLRLTDPLYRAAAAAGNIHSDPSLLSHAALEANAIGFGTLKYQPASAQDLQSTAVWADGHWFVTIYHSISSPKDGDIEFASGKRIPITVAIWNGSKGDRNGTKMISGWHWLVVDGVKPGSSATPHPRDK